MMVDSNVFSRATERGIMSEESRDMALDAHGELGPELGAGGAGKRSPEHSPGAGAAVCRELAPSCRKEAEVR